MLDAFQIIEGEKIKFSIEIIKTFSTGDLIASQAFKGNSDLAVLGGVYVRVSDIRDEIDRR